MFRFLSDLISAPKELAQARARLLDLERETQELRLHLDEKERLLKNVSADLERQEKQQNSVVEHTVRSEMENLADELAVPVAQLLTQEYLIRQENNQVSVPDVLVLVRRVVKSLERSGLAILGSPGLIDRFDSNYHECLNDGEPPNPGDEVSIKMVGVSYKGKVLKRAIVVRQ